MDVNQISDQKTPRFHAAIWSTTFGLCALVLIGIGFISNYTDSFIVTVIALPLALLCGLAGFFMLLIGILEKDKKFKFMLFSFILNLVAAGLAVFLFLYMGRGVFMGQ